MAANSIFFTFLNTTTVDNLSRRTRTYHFAVLLSSSHRRDHAVDALSQDLDSALSPSYPTITYPLPSSHPLSNKSYSSYSHPRTFAILATQPGTNPYKLLTPWQNFQAVMGRNPIDWFLPARSSPNYSRRAVDEQDLEAGSASGGRSMYELGPQFYALCKSANVLVPAGILTDNVRSRKGGAAGGLS